MMPRARPGSLATDWVPPSGTCRAHSRCSAGTVMWGARGGGQGWSPWGSQPQPRLHPGDRYWVFKDNNVEEGYPRPISDFSLPPGGVDAAFAWAHNDRTYFFKDQLYWRYDDRARRMDPGFPAQGPLWRGVPSRLDDAMRWSDGERRAPGSPALWPPGRFPQTPPPHPLHPQTGNPPVSTSPGSVLLLSSATTVGTGQSPGRSREGQAHSVGPQPQNSGDRGRRISRRQAQPGSQ